MGIRDLSSSRIEKSPDCSYGNSLMTTNALKNIIARCHQRHEKPLQQQKSIVEPLLYKGLPYHFTVYCAHRYPVTASRPGDGRYFLYAERTVPLATDSSAASGFWRGTVLGTPAGDRLGCQPMAQVMGDSSVYGDALGARWRAHGMTSTLNMKPVCTAPDAILACVQALVDSVANPLLTMSKSGGLRFSCRIPGYLHPEYRANTVVC